MTISGADLLDNIGSLLYDDSNEVWDDTLKVSLVNEALKVIVLARPDASVITETFTVVADTPKQTIPATGIRLLDVLMNTNGAPIRKTTKEDLNDTIPAWTITTGSAIETYAFDEENPTIFWLQPVPNSALSIDISYSNTPTTFSAGSTSIGIAEIYVPAVKEYVLARCYGMPTSGVNLVKSANHMTAFYKIIGIKLQSDAILQQVQEA